MNFIIETCGKPCVASLIKLVTFHLGRKHALHFTHPIEEALNLSDRVIVLSGKSPKIKKEFNIPFPRPRQESIILSDEFLHGKQTIYNELRGS